MVENSAVLNELLVRLFRDISTIEEKALRTGRFDKMTVNDMHVMEAIGTGEPKNMSSVAKTLGVTMGTLTISVNSLVKKGLVTRIRSEADKRVVLISLTDAGTEAYEHHMRFHEQLIEHVVQGFSEEEVKVLERALSNLQKFIQQ